MEELLTRIAQKHLLIDDLVEVGDDEKDFYDCPKACIREALREAFLAGAAVGALTETYREAA
jgi:hypothetical protein